jgi:hypothetical protein
MRPPIANCGGLFSIASKTNKSVASASGGVQTNLPIYGAGNGKRRD